MTARSNPEAALQVQVKKYLGYCLPPQILWTASLAGHGKMTMHAATKAKAMGVKRGFPDLQFLFPDGVTRYIELKSQTGSLSPEQRVFRSHALTARPDIWACCRSLEDVHEALSNWGANLRSTSLYPLSSGGLAAG